MSARESKSIGYTEKPDALQIRIEAHKKYSNFSLEEWIEANLPIGPSGTLFDIGCGSGNLFPSYGQLLGEAGTIVGLDHSEELLERALAVSTAASKVLFKGDMNKPFPLVSGQFDHIISTFAIYYAEDISSLLLEVKRLLKPLGRFFFIGPTDNNAGELYQFNKAVFGFGRDRKIDKRTNRLEKEFSPACDALFRNVSAQRIRRKLVFPDKEKFVEYYTATLLFEESVKKAGREPDGETLLGVDLPSLEVSKEMILLTGEK